MVNCCGNCKYNECFKCSFDVLERNGEVLEEWDKSFWCEDYSEVKEKWN